MNSYFSDYIKTLDILENQDKIEQKNNKCTHFLRYIREALLTYVSQWKDSILSLSLYFHQPTASCVARMILRH